MHRKNPTLGGSSSEIGIAALAVSFFFAEREALGEKEG
jgi:hypothetical protein